MSASVESLLVAIGLLRGGTHRLYKPVVQVEWFEHEDAATVRVGRCKGMEEVVYETYATGPGSLTKVLYNAFENLKATGAE